jgi:MFS family permease
MHPRSGLAAWSADRLRLAPPAMRSRSSACSRFAVRVRSPAKSSRRSDSSRNTRLSSSARTGCSRVPSASAPLYRIAFAVGNLAGPLTIGHFFDTIGRRKMIAGTYLLSGILLAISAVLFYAGVLNAITQTIAWCIIFYFASAGASAAYLTMSEIFPLEVRAKAIAVFFAIAQCFGALGPGDLRALIGDGTQPIKLFLGYLLGAAVMIAGGLAAWFLAVDAEGRSLEDTATPLAAASTGRRGGSVRAEGTNPPSSP